MFVIAMDTFTVGYNNFSQWLLQKMNLWHLFLCHKSMGRAARILMRFLSLNKHPKCNVRQMISHAFSNQQKMMCTVMKHWSVQHFTFKLTMWILRFIQAPQQIWWHCLGATFEDEFYESNILSIFFPLQSMSIT